MRSYIELTPLTNFAEQLIKFLKTQSGYGLKNVCLVSSAPRPIDTHWSEPKGGTAKPANRKPALPQGDTTVSLLGLMPAQSPPTPSHQDPQSFVTSVKKAGKQPAVLADIAVELTPESCTLPPPKVC